MASYPHEEMSICGLAVSRSLVQGVIKFVNSFSTILKPIHATYIILYVFIYKWTLLRVSAVNRHTLGEINTNIRLIHKIYIYLLTYLLTPWSRVLLEKLASLQLVKRFPAFYGTRRFLTALTSARQLSLFWASPIQSSYPTPTSWRSILILSSHLRLGLPSGLLLLLLLVIIIIINTLFSHSINYYKVITSCPLASVSCKQSSCFTALDLTWWISCLTPTIQGLHNDIWSTISPMWMWSASSPLAFVRAAKQ